MGGLSKVDDIQTVHFFGQKANFFYETQYFFLALQTVRNFNWIIMLSSITVPRFIIPKFFGKIKRNVDSSLTTRVILHNYACFRKLRLDPLIQKLNEEK